jgi:hypothetical protein
MKSRNVIVSLILALFLFAAGGAWWLFMSIDGLVKQAIERWGPEITGVTVKVDSVRIQVAEGRGTIRGLVVGNPKGFQAKHSLKLDEIRLTIDPASITKDVVVIRELLLAAPEVVYERGQGSDNLSIIQKNADAWVAKNSGAPAKDAGPGKKLVIESLVIRNGKAHFGEAISLPMPDMQLRDVGKKSNGATAGDVVKQVWRAMLGNVGTLASSLGSAIKEGAAGAVDGVKKLFK